MSVSTLSILGRGGWEGRGGRHFGEGGLAIKVIPQYCTAHPVLRITKHNRQQNIMAAFLAGKLASEKNGRFGKVWLGKKGGNLWQRRRRQLSESVEIVESAKTTDSRVVEQVRWSFPLKRTW